MEMLVLLQMLISWPLLTCESDSYHWFDGTYCIVTECCLEHENGLRECSVKLEGDGCYRIPVSPKGP